MNQEQVLGALVILSTAALAAWVAAGVIELITERREEDEAPLMVAPKRDHICPPQPLEWAIEGTGRHRKEVIRGSETAPPTASLAASSSDQPVGQSEAGGRRLGGALHDAVLGRL